MLGAHVLTAPDVLPVSDQAPHADHVPELQVRVWICSRSHVFVPLSPDGQDPVVATNWVWLEAPVQVAGAQVLVSVPVTPVSDQPLQTEFEGAGNDVVPSGQL